MSSLAAAVIPEEHFLGARRPKHTLVQYGDLQCPDTAMAEPALTEMLEIAADNVRFVFRHFPMADIHPNAYMAAEAVEAAGAQNRFWEMRQLLLDNQDTLDLDSLQRFARELRIDPVRLGREIESHAHAAKIDRDIASGMRSGVVSTPSFFLDGEMIDPGLDLYEVFESLDEEDEDDEG